ncbi:hypothetical protein L1049_028312 [Liquidambar formosana]|uniref:Uncharacterized protein n=1 Tax=Liquidambar formosana TaxID=63359 RepID=A0AAP0RIJ7_LIQFO
MSLGLDVIEPSSIPLPIPPIIVPSSVPMSESIVSKPLQVYHCRNQTARNEDPPALPQPSSASPVVAKSAMLLGLRCQVRISFQVSDSSVDLFALQRFSIILKCLAYPFHVMSTWVLGAMVEFDNDNKMADKHVGEQMASSVETSQQQFIIVKRKNDVEKSEVIIQSAQLEEQPEGELVNKYEKEYHNNKA